MVVCHLNKRSRLLRNLGGCPGRRIPPRREVRVSSASHVRGVQAATQCIGAGLSGHRTETVPSSLRTRMSNLLQYATPFVL